MAGHISGRPYTDEVENCVVNGPEVEETLTDRAYIEVSDFYILSQCMVNVAADSIEHRDGSVSHAIEPLERLTKRLTNRHLQSYRT